MSQDDLAASATQMFRAPTSGYMYLKPATNDGFGSLVISDVSSVARIKKLNAGETNSAGQITQVVDRTLIEFRNGAAFRASTDVIGVFYALNSRKFDRHLQVKPCYPDFMRRLAELEVADYASGTHGDPASPGGYSYQKGELQVIDHKKIRGIRDLKQFYPNSAPDVPITMLEFTGGDAFALMMDMPSVIKGVTMADQMPARIYRQGLDIAKIDLQSREAIIADPRKLTEHTQIFEVSHYKL